ncbi:MAG TPA: sialate O-acetylesterase, partial [Acidimicrobiales bacterium]
MSKWRSIAGGRRAALVGVTCALGMAAMVTASAASPRAPTHTLTVLVVAGQSNATGAESYVISPTTHRSVFGASPADTAVGLTLWGPFVDPPSLPPRTLDYPQVSSPARRVATFGPEVGLARGLWAVGNRSLVVEKVVANGTTLAVDWRPRGRLFNVLVARTLGLVAWAGAHGERARIGGIYWVQGESDAAMATHSAAYRANLTAFVAALRAALRVTAATPFTLAETTTAP